MVNPVGQPSHTTIDLTKLFDLPAPAILAIFQNYTTQQLLDARLTNKKWKQVIDNSDIWRRIAEKFSLKPTISNPSPVSYKQLILQNCNNKSFMLAKVKIDGMLLQYASPRLQKDNEVAEAAIKQNAEAWQFSLQNYDDLIKIKPDIKSKRDCILHIMQYHGSDLGKVDQSFRKDREIVLTAVKQYGNALKYADEKYKKDPEIVLAAFAQNGKAFYEEELEEIALDFADKNLLNDKDFMFSAVKLSWLAVKVAKRELLKDKDFILIAVKEWTRALKYADISLRSKKEFMLEAVKIKGLALEHADKTLQKDKDVVLAAVTQNPEAILFADQSLQNDPEILAAIAMHKKLKGTVTDSRT